MTQVSARFHFNRFLFSILTLSCDQNKTAVFTLPTGILIQQPCLIELAIRIISQMSCQCLMLLLYFCSVTISLKRLVMDLLFIFSPYSLYLNAFLMHNIQSMQGPFSIRMHTEIALILVKQGSLFFLQCLYYYQKKYSHQLSIYCF